MTISKSSEFVSYNVDNFILFVERIKDMNKFEKYLTQKKFANWCIKKLCEIDVNLKRVWSWIKQNKNWNIFHIKFEKFENDYFVIVSLIRQVRDNARLKKKLFTRSRNNEISTRKTLTSFLFTHFERFENARLSMILQRFCKYLSE